MHFPAATGAPLVSIVIPVYDNWRYTNGCLRALAASLDPSIPVEVLVVDDASSDRTRDVLARCSGIRVVRNDSNLGFVGAANAGASVARGAFVHFLNNDAFVAEGWLRPLLDAFDDARVAAVVSQLRYPDDRLAEAGGIVWADARGTNYGRGEAPDDWRYRSPREVDYGSAASLMVRREAFAKAGGFAPAFAPAFYEDADLCFALRAKGFRVAYEPRSVVYHAEGATYGSNVRAGTSELQERNRVTFSKKWSSELHVHCNADPTKADGAARRLAGRIALVVDEHVPFTDRDAGSRRTAALIELLRERDWHVLFGSIDAIAHEPFAAALRARGVEVIPGFDDRTLAALVRSGIVIELAWLCRPAPAQRFMPALRRLQNVKIVFDTVDLHHVRLERMERLRGEPSGWQAMRRLELDLAHAADATVATSAVEADLLARERVARVHVLPVVEPPARGDAPGWRARDGVVFLGNYAHEPNVDAAQRLCTAVMPLVWQRLPNLRVTLAGADPTLPVRALAGGNVAVTGFVEDAAELLARHRVFAAPIGFGAGVKGKIVYAMAHGIPVVTTAVGAEGIFVERDYDGVAASDEDAAERIVRLHEDESAWNALAARGGQVAEAFSPEAAGRALDALLERLYAD